MMEATLKKRHYYWGWKALSPYSFDLAILLLAVALLALFFEKVAIMSMVDDAFNYQKFTQYFVHSHNISFMDSHIGFQGQALFTIPYYWWTQSPQAILEVNTIFSFLNIFAAYFLGLTYTGERSGGRLMALTYLLVPTFYITGIRGWVEGIQLFWIFILLISLKKNSLFSFIAFAIVVVIKPLGLCFLPALLYLGWKKFAPKKRIFAALGWHLIAVSLLALHMLGSYLEMGRLINNVPAGGNWDTPTFSTIHILYNMKRYLNFFVFSRDYSNYIHPVLIWTVAIAVVSFLFANWGRKRGWWDRTEFFLGLSLLLNLATLLPYLWWFDKYLIHSFVLLLLGYVVLANRRPYFRVILLLAQALYFGTNAQSGLLSKDLDTGIDSLYGLAVIWLLLAVLYCLDLAYTYFTEGKQRWQKGLSFE